MFGFRNLTFYSLVIGLVLTTAAYAEPREISDYIRFPRLDLPQPSQRIYPDPDENFVSMHFQATLGPWNLALQNLESEIKKTIVLPASVIRTFLLSLENNQNPDYCSLHVILGDHSPVGMSELVRAYLLASGRPHRHITPSSDLQDIVRFLRTHPRGVVIFDKPEKFDNNDQLAVQQLVTKTDFLKGGSIIVLARPSLLDPPRIQNVNEFYAGLATMTAGREFNLVSYADSVHVIRRPLSAGYYQRIIELFFRQTNGGNMERWQFSVARELATIAADLQDATDLSQMTLLNQIISHPTRAVASASYPFACGGALAEEIFLPTVSQAFHRLIAVAQTIQNHALGLR